VHTRERVVAMTVRVTTLKGPDAGVYYVEALPSYYLDGDEPRGVWHGEGADRLGLVGEVDDDAFLAVMAGLDPDSGEPLGRNYGETSVRGFDVTASAPKSVSVLFAVGDGATRQAVLDAHDAAVTTMVDWIGAHAHTRYRIDGEVAIVDAEGIAAACFRQHTSRALDPQLHTHVVIPNRVASDDGRWLSLDARTIKFDQRTLSALYHASLRAELTRSLGVAWQAPVNGIAEMRDVGDDVRQEFSSRTRAVEERIEDKLEHFAESFERNPTPRERWRLERDAVTDCRPSKSHGEDAQALHAEWAERAIAIGHAPDQLVAAAVSPERIDRVLDDLDAEAVVAQALDALTESQSTWRPAELVRELAAAIPTDVTVASRDLMAWLDRTADAVVGERLIDISRPIPDGVALRRDGRPVTESVADRALTTSEILAQEERLIAWAERRLEAGGSGVAIGGTTAEVLTKPQLEVASELAGTKALVLIVGPAGTGKTTAVAPAVEELRATGQAVFGVAPSAAAAEVLAVDAGLSADTVDKLLVEHRLDRPPDHRYDLPVGATVVVDEAAMVCTPKLAELADLADDRGWRLALVGDPLQFSAVGRGGMFSHLIDCFGAIELDRVHRFANDWEREASLRLRRGDTEVLTLYDDHGRLHGGTRRQMERAVVEAWWEARAQGHSAAMMAATNETVVALNRRAQALRADHGEIDLAGPSADVANYRLCAGDRVATRRNDRQLRTDRGLMVKNRDQWDVLAVHPGGALTVSGRTGAVRLPGDYVAEHVELAYAQTSHANQGRTVDVSFLFVDGPTDTRGVYVPLTRGRLSNEAFVAVDGEDTAVDVLARALGRHWIDEPAVARRAALADRAQSRHDGGAEVALGSSELRALLERAHTIAYRLSRVDTNIDTYGRQLAEAIDSRTRGARQVSEATARRDQAQQVIDDYDHPLRRRLHRCELDQAHTTLCRSQHTIRESSAGLVNTDAWVSQLEGLLADAEQTQRDRPRLERERQSIMRRVEKDLGPRRSALAADPPDYIIDRIGPRPDGGVVASLWDDTAARLDQHLSAFDDTAGSVVAIALDRPWEINAFAASERAASRACQRLDRSLGRTPSHGPAIEPPGLEPPGLELGIGM